LRNKAPNEVLEAKNTDEELVNRSGPEWGVIRPRATSPGGIGGRVTAGSREDLIYGAPHFQILK
jgi:hypothetical protein